MQQSQPRNPLDPDQEYIHLIGKRAASTYCCAMPISLIPDRHDTSLRPSRITCPAYDGTQEHKHIWDTDAGTGKPNNGRIAVFCRCGELKSFPTIQERT